MSSIQVELADQEKWAQFHPKTEMIVTKAKGRVIFPHLAYVISGLQPEILYTIHLHLERVDSIKYKFEGVWKEASKGDVPLPIKYKEHLEGARTGKHWMSGTVSFASMRLTNNPDNDDRKTIVVQSMHKYQPVVTVTKFGEMRGEEFRLNVTEFIAVTAYQSEEMIQLKVKHNKYASGFRSTGKRRGSPNSGASDAKRESPFSGCSSNGSSTSGSPALQNFNICDSQQNVQQNFQSMQMYQMQPFQFQQEQNQFQMMNNQMNFQFMNYPWYGYPMNPMVQFGGLADWNTMENKENRQETDGKPITFGGNGFQNL